MPCLTCELVLDNKKLSSKRFCCIGGCIAKTTPKRDLYTKDEIKEGSVPGNYFFFYLDEVSNLERRPCLYDKTPQEHSILTIRRTSVVASV